MSFIMIIISKSHDNYDTENVKNVEYYNRMIKNKNDYGTNDAGNDSTNIWIWQYDKKRQLTHQTNEVWTY